MKKVFFGTVAALFVTLFSACTFNSQNENTPVNSLQSLANVEKVEINLTEKAPLMANLKISGNLRNGCEQIDRMTSSFSNGAFNVFLQVKTEGEVCSQAIVPYEKPVSLNVSGLQKGEYKVRVNNKEFGSFNIN